MKEVLNKRGLSPVIASVLLILLVLVLASILFVWARGFVGEQIEKFGQPVEEVCRNVDFQVAKIGDDLLDVKLEVKNDGSINIRHLEARLTKGGESELLQFDFPINKHDAVTKSVSFAMPNSTDTPDEIIIYPALIGNVVGDVSTNNIFTCLDSGVKLV